MDSTLGSEVRVYGLVGVPGSNGLAKEARKLDGKALQSSAGTATDRLAARVREGKSRLL